MSKSTYNIYEDIVSAIRKVFDDYSIVNMCTSDGRVVVDVSDRIADWIWEQEIGTWETVGAVSGSWLRRRYVISQELLTLLVLRWPK